MKFKDYEKFQVIVVLTNGRQTVAATAPTLALARRLAKVYTSQKDAEYVLLRSRNGYYANLMRVQPAPYTVLDGESYWGKYGAHANAQKLDDKRRKIKSYSEAIRMLDEQQKQGQLLGLTHDHKLSLLAKLLGYKGNPQDLLAIVRNNKVEALPGYP